MKKLAVLPLLLITAACSTIIEGKSQQLTINTNPAGAKCTLNRKDTVIGSVDSTPGSVNIEKTKNDIKVICNKEGYQETTYLNHSGIAGATFGNIALGGLIGWGVDSATGADNKYDSPMNITLAPEEKHAARADRAASAKN
ncbi:MAG TPA: PEGA domain-containing protein [Rickettsiales bacterium]|nr:PEGA domain-containing protein [Rickettsiales bacterium]